jgi:hypothetical protein
MTELFAMAMWAALYYQRAVCFTFLAKFEAQTIKLLPAMKTIRTGLLPIALLAVSFAPFAQALGVPGFVAGGSNVEDHSAEAAEFRDEISLDEAVRRAEAQYHAKVVRTDVQDEDGRKVYVLKLLSEDGRVITVRVDASTGRSR